jgi:FkbM family methyltransferase
VRKLLNKFLRPVGYRIERISPFAIQLERLAKLDVIQFVQIGANDGVRFDDLSRFLMHHACKGLVIEPLPDVFLQLQANYAEYPSITPINKAIHASARSLPLYRVEPNALRRYPAWAAGIASFDREHLRRHDIDANDIKSESVECVPLMALLTQHDLLELDLLQIDTEGYDAEIIRMIDFARCRPRVIKYEHKTLSREGRAELEAMLQRHGYRSAREATDTVAWR